MNQSTVSLAASLPGASENAIAQTIAISQRLFPGPVSVHREFDPEQPDEQWLSFCVKASGEIPGIFDQEILWHQEVSQVVPDFPGLFRLNVSLTS